MTAQLRERRLCGDAANVSTSCRSTSSSVYTVHTGIIRHTLQCESKFFAPSRFFVNISPTTEDFKIKLYTSILCSYLWKITNFYSIQL